MTPRSRHASTAARLLLVTLVAGGCRTATPRENVRSAPSTSAGATPSQSPPAPAPPDVTSAAMTPAPSPSPPPEPPLALRCDDIEIKIPDEWHRPLAVAFAARSTSEISQVDRHRLAAMVEQLRARPELAAYLEGFRVEDGDTRQVVLQRMRAVRSHLVRQGVPPGQVLLEPYSQFRAWDNHSVDVRLIRRPADPVAPGEPCGTTTLRASAKYAERVLAAQGLWSQFRDHTLGVRDYRIVTRDALLEPLQGVEVAALVRRDGGYLAAAWRPVEGTIEFGLFDRRGRLERVKVLAIPDIDAWWLALVAREHGFIAAWSSGGDIYTITLDPAGDPLRPLSREVDGDASVHAIAMDWRLGAGGIAYVTYESEEGSRGKRDLRLKFVPIDGEGHVRGAPRTFMAHESWLSSIAVATLSPDRVSILVDACDTFTRRLDVDAHGELVAIDTQFLRKPNVLGAAVMRRANSVWAVTLSKEWMDLRPLCELPATTPGSPRP